MIYTFVVTAQEAQVIANALAAQPYAQVAAIIAKMQAQASEQEAAPPNLRAVPGAVS